MYNVDTNNILMFSNGVWIDVSGPEDGRYLLIVIHSNIDIIAIRSDRIGFLFLSSRRCISYCLFGEFVPEYFYCTT